MIPLTILAEALRAARDDAGGREALIYICRDIPGDHTPGVGCFCSPTVVSTNQSLADIDAAVIRDAMRQ